MIRVKADKSNVLMNVRILNQKLISAKEKLLELDDSLKKITIELNGLPKPQGYVKLRVETLVAMKVEIERQIAELEEEIQGAKADLTTKLFEMDLSTDERRILLRRYVNLENFDTIAQNLFFSKSKVFTLHRLATKKILQM